jgi:O-antigen/teichoic acid export membrane protein
VVLQATHEPEAGGISRWISKSMGALTDQGLFAGSNFIINICLARVLLPAEYGTFALAFTILMFVGSFHESLFIVPMVIYGNGRYEQHLPRYLGVLVWLQLLAAVPVSAVLALTGLVCWWLGGGLLASAFWSLALMQPAVFFLWLMRRACYIRSEPGKAALTGALHLLLLISMVAALETYDVLGVAAALLAIGLSSLVAALWLAPRLGVIMKRRDSPISVREVAENHWRYGRWASATGIAGFVPGNIYYLLMPIFGGLAATGALRAMMILTQPIVQATNAMRLLLMPVLVRCRGTPAFERKLRLYTVLLTAGPLLFWLLLGLGGSELVRLLYGDRFGEHATLLWGVGLLPVLASVSGILGAAMCSAERPDLPFYAGLTGAIVALTLGVGLMAWFGLAGVIGALLVSSLADVIVVARLSRGYLKENRCR